MSASYPKISGYKPFYIQTEADTSAIDIADEYGLIVRTSPLTDLPEMKAPASNDWYDEDGVDEYLNDTHFKAMEYEVKFFLRTEDSVGISAPDALSIQKRAFFDKIRKGTFSFYDGYWKLGRRGVRYVSYSETSKRQGSNWAREIFTIKFQINDPLTEMTYDGLTITEA